MTWEWVRGFGNSRLMQTSYIWLFVLPVTAKTFSEIDNSVQINIFEADLPLSTVLPFTWQLVFLTALSLTIANLIYMTRCPQILRLYESHDQFRKKGQTLQQVHFALKSLVWDDRTATVKSVYASLVTTYLENFSPAPSDQQSLEDQVLALVSDIDSQRSRNLSSSAFYWVRNVGARYHQKSIAACILFYVIGLLALAMIICENSWYVYSTLLH